MSDEILRALQVLSAPGQVIEVRAITDDRIASGYFNDPALLAAAVEPLDSLPTVQGIYVTLNEITPALLSRRANRIEPRLGKKDATTADTDILRRRWLPVDVDPVRPSGVSSTNAEHESAITTAERIADHLADLGWPAPVIADSGDRSLLRGQPFGVHHSRAGAGRFPAAFSWARRPRRRHDQHCQAHRRSGDHQL